MHLNRKAAYLLGFILFLVSLSSLAYLFTDYSIELNTDSPVYEVGQTVHISGMVTANDLPAQCTLGVQISSPIHTVYVNQLDTDTHGNFEDSFTLKPDSKEGTYNIFASCGGDFSLVEFTVLKPYTLTVEVTEQSSSEHTIEVSGSLIGENVEAVPVAIQVESPAHAIVHVDQTLTGPNGGYTFTFTLPEDAPKGKYFVHVGAKNTYTSDYFEVS